MPVFKWMTWTILALAGMNVLVWMVEGDLVFLVGAVSATALAAVFHALDRIVDALEDIRDRLVPLEPVEQSAGYSEEEVLEPVRSLQEIQSDLDRLKNKAD